MIIPIKAPPDRKSRLAATLGAEARDSLAMAMAGHVARAGVAAAGIDSVAFLAAAPDGLPRGIAVMADESHELNRAVGSALCHLLHAGATRVLVVAGDLPQVTSHDLALLAEVSAEVMALAPDRHGTGTNAISLPLPAATGFGFAFGPDSLSRHRAEAARLSLELVEIRSAGLERDIDRPEDLADAAGLLDSS